MDRPLNILLASDLSARSDRPFDRAVQLAVQTGGKLTLLHVVEKKSEYADRDDDEIAAAIRADLPETGIDFDILIGHGKPPATIAKTAEETGADLIVTGVARHNGLRDVTLGTAVDYVVRRSQVPVLVVKKRALKPYRSLLVATDFSDCSLDAAISAAGMFPDAEIALVHAYHVPYGGFLESDATRREVSEEALEGLEDFLPKLPGDLRERIDTKLGEGDLSAVVAQEFRDRGADLLVLGTHGRSGFAQATIGSNAQTMLTWALGDVLMVRTRK